MGLTLADVGGWPTVIGRLVARDDLSADQAAAALTDIFEGNATSAQIAAFATLLHAKGETVEELQALVATMLAFAEPIAIDLDVIDTCGSGGSEQRRAGAFNVSTITALVLAGAGAKVLKHGGRAASATSSSADLLTALGVQVELGPEDVVRCVRDAGMGFCFAPRFHSAMRHAAPTRRELGVPTVFNFIAPLNPARPRRQVLGVSDPNLAEKMLLVLQANGAVRAMVVFGHDGLDELTTTTTSTVLELRDGHISSAVIDPTTLGLARTSATELRGGDANANAEMTKRVLGGEHGPHRDIVVLNAAAGIIVAGLESDWPAAVARAQAALDDGRAGAALDALVAASQA